MMPDEKESIDPILCAYAVFNTLARLAKLALYGTALYVAFKPGGSVLAALIIALIAGAIKTRSYSADMAGDD